MMKTRPNIISL